MTTPDKRSHLVSFFFLFLRKNICCGYSLEAPRGGASNEYPQHIFLRRNKKSINTFCMKKASYLKISSRQESYSFVCGRFGFIHTLFRFFPDCQLNHFLVFSFLFFLFFSFLFFSFVVIIVVIFVVVTISIGFVDQINYSYTLLQQCFN